MRIYTSGDDNHLLLTACNMCGAELPVENGLLKAGCFHGEQRFGYFSHKDGQKHSFDLCESCYNKFIKMFKIPVDITDETEFL